MAAMLTVVTALGVGTVASDALAHGAEAGKTHDHPKVTTERAAEPKTGHLSAAAKAAEIAKLPPPKAHMRVIAKAARGAWYIEIENLDDQPLRIPTDIRLLRLEVWPLAKNRKSWSRRPQVCDGPKTFGITDFPHTREVLLEPGQSWVEQFDPRLICFGKQLELLAPGNKVIPSFGYEPKPTWSRRAEKAPFVLDGTQRPRRVRPVKRLRGPGMLLSHTKARSTGRSMIGRDTTPESLVRDALRRKRPVEVPPPIVPEVPDPDGEVAPPTGDDKAKAVEPGQADPNVPHLANPAGNDAASRGEGHHGKRRRRPKDELAAAFTLTTSRVADVYDGTEIAVSVQAHNTGGRPVLVALRARQLSFIVEGPDGIVKCRRQTTGHRVPRDLFRTLEDGKHIHMAVLLSELCPLGTFARPGLYIATPTLHADASGRSYGFRALTGRVTTRDPGEVGGTHDEHDDAIVVRVRHGKRPFYRRRRPPLVAATKLFPLPR